MPEHRLLACFAHPDDEAFPVGGALASHTRRGVDVRLITTTLGEEGEIRQEGSATRDSLGQDPRGGAFLRRPGPAAEQQRTSGATATRECRAGTQTTTPRLLSTPVPTRSWSAWYWRYAGSVPQVLLSFGPDGLYGHPDHIAISDHTTTAFHLSADPSAYPEQRAAGLEPHQPHRLFYSVRPRGFRRQWAEALRGEGIAWPWPSPEQELQGVPEDEVHLELDVAGNGDMEAKIACILCHRTQVAPDWPYHRVPRHVTARILGREFYVRAHPPVPKGETVGADFFAGI